MCREEIIRESQAGFIMLSDDISCARLHASSGSQNLKVNEHNVLNILTIYPGCVYKTNYAAMKHQLRT